MKKPPFVLLCLCVCLFFSACDKSDSSRTDTGTASEAAAVVVFVPKVTGNAFFESANAGVQAFAARHGFTVEYQGSPRAVIADQVAIIRQAVERGVGAICISSLDATALDEELKKARQAGVKVVTWDSDVSGDARSLMVSQGTPQQLGRMLVEMGAKSLAARGINPSRATVRYVWHYSRPSVTDQNSWQVAGEAYIRSFYPKWVNLNPENYYSRQDPETALRVGEQILTEHPEIDLIICNDSTSLPGQAKAAQKLGLNASRVTITGFASPNPMREFCKAGIVERWGLWDCGTQGALGCYLAHRLAAGQQLKVGDRVDVPDIGRVEVMPNTVLDPAAYTSPDSGVILLPQRLEFTRANVDDYNY